MLFSQAHRAYNNDLLTPMAQDDAVAKLARQIDAAHQAEHARRSAEEVFALRRRGAQELHEICADFVTSVNSRLAAAALDIAPPSFGPEMFRESGVNLIQIGSQGRQMHISFQAPAQLVSTEKFAMAYVLEGEIRTFNQQMLERFEIRTRSLFCCVEEKTAVWRSFDWRSANLSVVTRDFLASLMEPLF